MIFASLPGPAKPGRGLATVARGGFDISIALRPASGTPTSDSRCGERGREFIPHNWCPDFCGLESLPELVKTDLSALNCGHSSGLPESSPKTVVPRNQSCLVPFQFDAIFKAVSSQPRNAVREAV